MQNSSSCEIFRGFLAFTARFKLTHSSGLHLGFSRTPFCSFQSVPGGFTGVFWVVVLFQGPVLLQHYLQIVSHVRLAPSDTR